MARKPTIYTHLFPYHVTARSNNKDWFYISKDLLWTIIAAQAAKAQREERFLIHAFVLMDNHYHMIASTHEEFPLGIVMRNFQRRISREVNRCSGRINHVFGGPYKPSLIDSDIYYASVLRYVYQNPVEAKICGAVEDYPYSSLSRDDFSVSSPLTGIASRVPSADFIGWLNSPVNPTETSQIRRGLRKTTFKPACPLKI